MAPTSQLPKDVRKFASQMGVDLSGMEAEAEDMWEMLNKMSADSPAQYEQFIKQQFEDAKEGGADDDGAQSFRPTAGVCVQVNTIGGDGIKIRDMQSQTGKIMFINLVHHKALELPKDKDGKAVTEDRMTADGLEIPLALSPMRDLDDDSMALDIVFHPSVIARCETHNMFLSQIIDLCTSSITEDRGVKLSKGWKLQSLKYKGGRGADKMTPVLFPINQETGGGKDDKPEKDVLNSPSSLLGQIMKDKNIQESHVAIDIPGAEKKIGGAAGNDMIAASSTSTLSKDRTKENSLHHSVPKKPSMKKGFLGNSKEALYPEGSNEGAGSATGGAFARLMSRSQVVDTKTNSVSQPSAPLESKAASASDKSSVVSEKKEVEEADRTEPDVLSVMKVDALLDSLEEGGKMFTDKKNKGESKVSIETEANAIKVLGNFPSDNKVNVTKSADQTLKIKVENLHEIHDLSDDSVDLQVSKEAVSLSLKKTGKNLKVAGAFALDAASTAASFSKKKKILTVKVKIMPSD